MVCGKEVQSIGKGIGVCPDCIRNRWGESRGPIEHLHARSRERFLLPVEPPHSEDGLPCNLCFLGCKMKEDEAGYCAVRTGTPSSMKKDGRTRARVSYYFDPLPTNCVADWVCPGGTGAGYPLYAHTKGPESGYRNWAVFFEACNFNCLYCQNWTGFKQSHRSRKGWLSVDDMVRAAPDTASCVCFFGGDPTPQLPFALRFSRRILELHPGRIFRICWETNGSMNPAWLKSMVRLSLKSGGCIKVDLKAWNANIHYALCGCDNTPVLENFARLSRWIGQRPDPPLLLASTLLVPGYVDEDEIYGLASFIAGLSPDIPYSLLGFAPQFSLNDFPTTSREQAEACLDAALNAGLRRVRIGNSHLLH